MTADCDPSIEDMIRASYRLSWPGPVPRTQRPIRRLIGKVARLCRREMLEGWPVELRLPAA